MLKNKLILITGASSGIGEACAYQFAKAGAHLLLCARRLNVIQTLANKLQNEFGIKCYTFELNVCNRENVFSAINKLPPEWKSIDVLVNNAGLAAGLEPFAENNMDDWESMIDTNIKGLLYMTKAILPNMINKNSGHIINIGSVAGHAVYPKGTVYCASKFAVNAITQGLKMDLHGTNIRVSTVDPGAVETNFSLVRFKGDEERAHAVYKGFTPLTPMDVADAVLYVASRPSHVNINEIILMPTAQSSTTMIDRKA